MLLCDCSVWNDESRGCTLECSKPYTQWHSCLRFCALRPEVVGSIPSEVTGIFHWLNPLDIFSTCPDRPCGPPSLLYNGYRVFPRGKERSGRDADPSPPSSAVGHERVELYRYSPYGPYGLYRASVPVQGCTLPFFTLAVWFSEQMPIIIPHSINRLLFVMETAIVYCAVGTYLYNMCYMIFMCKWTQTFYIYIYLL